MATIYGRYAATACGVLNLWMLCRYRHNLHNPGSGIMDEVGGFLRVRGGGEYRAAVVPQDFQPVGDIRGVIRAGLKRQFKIGAQEGGSEFGHEFFHGVGVAAEAVAAEVPVKARLVGRRVGGFMRQGAVKRLRVAEGVEGRHLDIVVCEAVERGESPVPDIKAGGREKLLGAR